MALSFDDGPSRWTPAVLDLLAEHGARATFFVVGRHVEEHPDVAARAVAEGHELGNHTFDHVDCAHEQDDDVLRDQLRRANAASEAATGVAMKVIRPPYGKDVCRVARLGREQGLAPVVLWSVQAWDWDEQPADAISDRVLRDVGPGAIVLLHDGAPPYDDRSRDGTVEALARILPTLTTEGYEVVTVSELLELRA